VILLSVVALVTYALTHVSSPTAPVTPAVTSPAVLAALSTVPESTFDAVGVTVAGTTLTAPHLVAGPAPFTVGGKPDVLFVGAEFCPFCAAERWPMVVALARFGRFTELHDSGRLRQPLRHADRCRALFGHHRPGRDVHPVGPTLCGASRIGGPLCAPSRRRGGRHGTFRGRGRPIGGRHLGVQPRTADRTVAGPDCRRCGRSHATGRQIGHGVGDDICPTYRAGDHCRGQSAVGRDLRGHRTAAGRCLPFQGRPDRGCSPGATGSSVALGGHRGLTQARALRP
jgi:hypothetical protein